MIYSTKYFFENFALESKVSILSITQLLFCVIVVIKFVFVVVIAVLVYILWLLLSFLVLSLLSILHKCHIHRLKIIFVYCLKTNFPTKILLHTRTQRVRNLVSQLVDLQLKGKIKYWINLKDIDVYQNQWYGVHSYANILTIFLLTDTSTLPANYSIQVL